MTWPSEAVRTHICRSRSKAMPLSREKIIYKYYKRMEETNETGIQILREGRIITKH